MKEDAQCFIFLKQQVTGFESTIGFLGKDNTFSTAKWVIQEQKFGSFTLLLAFSSQYLPLGLFGLCTPRTACHALVWLAGVLPRANLVLGTRV